MDYGHFVRLHGLISQLAPPPTREAFRDHCSRVLMVDGPTGPIAMLALRMRGATARISMIAVDPLHQGQGIGRGMLLTASRGLRAKAVRSWSLSVKADNAVARSIFVRLGMREVSRGAYWSFERRQVARLPEAHSPLQVRPVGLEERKSLERAFGLPGRLLAHRQPGARVLVVEHGRRPVAIGGLHDPESPSAFVGAKVPGAIRPLLAQIWPTEPLIPVFTRSPLVGGALQEAGARLLFDFLDLEGPVPA